MILVVFSGFVVVLLEFSLKILAFPVLLIIYSSAFTIQEFPTLNLYPNGQTVQFLLQTSHLLLIRSYPFSHNLHILLYSQN